MISDLNDSNHEMMRKKAISAYSGKENLYLEQDTDECVLDFMRLIETKYLTVDEGPSIKMEFARKAHYFTTDVISLLSFGKKFNNLRDDRDNFGLITDIETLFPNIFCMAVFPEIVQFLTATGIFQLLSPAENPKLALGKVMAVAKRQIASRVDSQGDFKETYGDMMGSFIKHGMTRTQLEQETMVQL